MATITDLTNYAAFSKQIEILRNLFEISRKYYIAKIYFTMKKYLNSHQIFEHYVIPESMDYIEHFGEYKKEKTVKDKMYDFGELIEIEDAKKMMEDISKNAKKLAMLAKANYILCLTV